jgi:hypothetical protein
MKPYDTLTNHIVNPVNDAIIIEVMDQPGPGGAHHEYRLRVKGKAGYRTIAFQKGPIGEVGVNGLTQEALLAIIEHRLECFQAGPFACDTNMKALLHTQLALHFLKPRTRERMARRRRRPNQSLISVN